MVEYLTAAVPAWIRNQTIEKGGNIVPTLPIPFVDLKAQYHSMKEEIDAAIRNVIQDTAFIGGKYLEAFEQHFARFIGVKHCIGVANGTDALAIALRALDIQEGDEVITAANSYVATAEAITMTGARVVFVDCHENTYNIDVTQIENVITKKTKAIIPVHLYGQPADNAIVDIARRHDLFLLEDAAQAHGAQYKQKRIGTFGDCAGFSFYPGKNLGAYGDAGAVVTNNDDLARYMRMYRNHGGIQKYEHRIPGTNSRLDGLQAAILDTKLPYIEKWNDRRRAVAAMYDEKLRDVVETPGILPDVKHVYHLYVIRVKNRDKVRQLLAEQGIATGIHYPVPIPFLESYGFLHHTPADFPVAYAYKDELLSLPMHGDMTDEQVEYVVEHLKRSLG
jgi:dTDP-4-amino-4,6-dideoxygalactose transaminase